MECSGKMRSLGKAPAESTIRELSHPATQPVTGWSQVMVFGSENGIPLWSVVEKGNDLFPVSVVGTIRPDGPELLPLV